MLVDLELTTLKYKKCPRCGLNYIKTEEELCAVCQNEIDGKRSIFDDEDSECILCPYCERNYMGIDDVMCAQCEKRRRKSIVSDD